MNNQIVIPYISVIFVNRNDGYSGDQPERFNYFIDYYANFVKQYPDLFEFVICDWNPPKDRLPLIQAYDWQRLGKVKSISVSKEIHEHYAKDCKRPILDYIGRNASITRSSALWILVLNQDIFISPEIIRYLAKRKLNINCFYRADRVDFNFDKAKNFPVSALINDAKKNVIKRHLRPWPNDTSESISPSITANEYSTVLSRIGDLDSYDSQDKIVYGDGYSQLLRKLRKRNILKKFFGSAVNNRFYLQFGLHTNAAGDFIIATKKAFSTINGFPETTDFYMHTDSHAIVQLFTAGYTQAIFNQTEVFHADHSRHDRAIIEKWKFEDHALWFSNVCYGSRSFRFNSKHWGLEKITLKTQSFG